MMMLDTISPSMREGHALRKDVWRFHTHHEHQAIGLGVNDETQFKRGVTLVTGQRPITRIQTKSLSVSNRNDEDNESTFSSCYSHSNNMIDEEQEFHVRMFMTSPLDYNEGVCPPA